MHGLAVIVELQRDADDVIALPLHEPGHDGGIDTARHGDDDTRVLWPLRDIETVEHACHLAVLFACGAGRRPVRRRAFAPGRLLADPAVAISGCIVSNPLPVGPATPCRRADGLLGDPTGPVSGSPHLLRATIADRRGKGKGCAGDDTRHAVLARQSLPAPAMFTRYVRNCLAGDKGRLFHIRCFPPFFLLARHLLTRLAEEWPARSG